MLSRAISLSIGYVGFSLSLSLSLNYPLFQTMPALFIFTFSLRTKPFDCSISPVARDVMHWQVVDHRASERAEPSSSGQGFSPRCRCTSSISPAVPSLRENRHFSGPYLELWEALSRLHRSRCLQASTQNVSKSFQHLRSTIFAHNSLSQMFFSAASSCGSLDSSTVFCGVTHLYGSTTPLSKTGSQRRAHLLRFVNTPLRIDSSEVLDQLEELVSRLRSASSSSLFSATSTRSFGPVVLMHESFAASFSLSVAVT